MFCVVSCVLFYRSTVFLLHHEIGFLSRSSYNNNIGYVSVYMIDVVVNAATITCGADQNLVVTGEPAQIRCSGASRNPSITPVLPDGLRYANGVISGTPSGPSPYTTYTISTGRDWGTFVIGGKIRLPC